jgi:hypothetical protein
MKHLKTIAVVLMVVCIGTLLVACGSNTANHYYSSDKIDELIGKIDDLLARPQTPPTINNEIIVPGTPEPEWIKVWHLEYAGFGTTSTNGYSHLYCKYRAWMQDDPVSINPSEYNTDIVGHYGSVSRTEMAHGASVEYDTQDLTTLFKFPSGTFVNYMWGTNAYYAGIIEYEFYPLEIKIVSENRVYARLEGVEYLIVSPNIRATGFLPGQLEMLNIQWK